MAKRKHPSLKTLRQGQTVYLVVDESFRRCKPVPKTITKWFLYSKNEPLPPEGNIIDRMPISLMKKIFDMPGQVHRDLFYSKRRAERYAKS